MTWGHTKGYSTWKNEDWQFILIDNKTNEVVWWPYKTEFDVFDDIPHGETLYVGLWRIYRADKQSI